jgi:nucleoside-diphosphate-sugar epimerase
MANNESILITGGAGYIGSMLTSVLIGKGYSVTVLDSLQHGIGPISHLLLNENFTFVSGDVRDRNLIKKLTKSNGIIIPLAALVGAPICEKNEKLAYETNELAIKNLILELNSNHKLIFLNTNAGYGIGYEDDLCDENSPLNPTSIYGITKKNAEIAVMNFKNSVSFRLASVFGCSYRMRDDLLLHFYIRSAMLEKKIEVYEPTFIRNFVHILDVTNTIIFAIENFERLKNNIFNVGILNGDITKINIAKKIKSNIPEIKINEVIGEKDPDKRNYSVSTKKIESLGCKSLISLDIGIRELSIYYKNFR